MNSNFSILFFIILINILHICELVNTSYQLDDDAAMKALSCVNIVTQKFHKKEEAPRLYSPFVLACFVQITTEQAEKVLMGLEDRVNALSPSEIEALISIENLKKYPERVIKKKSDLLENTIKEIQRIEDKYLENKTEEDGGTQENDLDADDDDFRNNEAYKNKPSKKGILNLIKRGIKGLFSVVGAIWVAIVILVFLYLFLMTIRKVGDEEKKKKIEKDKKMKDGDNNKENEEKERLKEVTYEETNEKEKTKKIV